MCRIWPPGKNWGSLSKSNEIYFHTVPFKYSSRTSYHSHPRSMNLTLLMYLIRCSYALSSGPGVFCTSCTPRIRCLPPSNAVTRCVICTQSLPSQVGLLPQQEEKVSTPRRAVQVTPPRKLICVPRILTAVMVSTTTALHRQKVINRQL